MLKILGKTASINVRKVLWTCDELGLPFAREDWGAGFQSTQQPAFLGLNPNAMVPVLLEDDFVLWESHAICRYLAQRHGGEALWPTDARQRALVDQWLDWQATEFNNAWRYAFMALVRRSPAHWDSEQIGASVASWNRHVGILDAHLAHGSPYVAGDDFTLADIVIGLSLGRWRLAPITRPAYRAVDAYCARLAQRPGFQHYAGTTYV
jgi:glutathione S-transferase